MNWGSGNKPTWPGLILNQNVSSTGQTGGITAHTVNLGPRRRTMNSPEATDLKRQILTTLPRDRPIEVSSVMGDAECFEFAAQLSSFLRDNGFNVSSESQAIFNKPVRGLQVDQTGNPIHFYVGPE